MVTAADGSPRAVVLAGGWMHPPEEPVAALCAVLTERDFATEVVTDPSTVEGALSPPPELLAVAACWFSMTDGRYNDRQRAVWAVAGDRARERAIAGAVEAGTPVLAVHTGVICFDDWAGWEPILGGRWDWSTSSHPPPAEMAVDPVPGSPLGIEPFSVVDEEYRGLRLNPTSKVVARSADGHPLVWVVDDRPRRAVDVLGHDHRSLENRAHRRLLGDLVDWLIEDGSLANGPDRGGTDR